MGRERTARHRLPYRMMRRALRHGLEYYDGVQDHRTSGAPMSSTQTLFLRPDADRAHSTKHSRTSRVRRRPPRTHAGGNEGRRYTDSGEVGEALLRALTQPVLVIQGTEDRCQPQARMENLVRLTGAEHLVIEGSGHLPMARHPIVVNRAIKRFVDRVTCSPAPSRRWTTAAAPAGLLYRSPIGLGHVRRDLASSSADESPRRGGSVVDAVPVRSPARRERTAPASPMLPASRALRVRVGRPTCTLQARTPEGRGVVNNFMFRRPVSGGVRPLGRDRRGPRYFCRNRSKGPRSLETDSSGSDARRGDEEARSRPTTRRDGRARARYPACVTGRCSSATPATSWTGRSARACRAREPGPRSTSTSPAT